MDKQQALKVMLKWASDNPYEFVPEIQEAYEVLRHDTNQTKLEKYENNLNNFKLMIYAAQTYEEVMLNVIAGHEYTLMNFPVIQGMNNILVGRLAKIDVNEIKTSDDLLDLLRGVEKNER